MIGDQKNEKFLFKIKIFVLIIEIIVVGIIAFIFFGVSKVNAAQMNLASWNIRKSDNSWEQFSNGQQTGARTLNLIGLNFDGTTGNANGVAYIEGTFLNNMNATDITISYWTSPTNNGNGTVSKSCTVTKQNNFQYKLKCQINFTYVNYSNDIKITIGLPDNYYFYDLTVTGNVDVQPTNAATTNDIVNQTIQIINEMYQNIQNSISGMNAAADKIIDADDERYQAYLQFLEDTNTSRWTEEDEIQEEQTGLLQSILGGINRLFSSSVDDPEDALGELNEDLGDDTPISNLFLLPVSLYQNVINNINGTCNSINLGSLWNHDLIMTCISIPSIIGNTLYGVIDILISGFFILAIRKKFIEIFENLSNLHTRRNELE